VSGSLWYGIGGSVQIFLFTIVALELKKKAGVSLPSFMGVRD
jgi:hypothetical protein